MDQDAPRLYSDLAWLWPLWEDVEEYRAEVDFYVDLIMRRARIEPRTILDLGCGGGKTAYHLSRYFQVTGLDLSAPMLQNARQLNPEVEFIKGDMRSIELGRLFDAVFINDAVAHMKTSHDLRAVFRTAWRHLRPGGVMLVTQDYIKETFSPNETSVSTGGRGNIEVTFIENIYDPDPDDDTCETLLVFLIRESGKLRLEHDLFALGLFPRHTWLESLTAVGFEVLEEKLSLEAGADPRALPVYACLKPCLPSEA